MRIVSDENTYIIPFDNNNNKTIVVSNSFKNDLLECLNSYFVMKKKTKCIIYDDKDILNMNDVNFIYLDDDFSYDNNLGFKMKSVMNNEVSEIIKNNQDWFSSIEKIREDLLDLETDKGIYKLQRVLSSGLDTDVKIFLDDFNINSLLQMLSIDYLELPLSVKQIIIMNLLTYVNKNKVNLVYIDKNFDANIQRWISRRNEVYFLIDNDAITSVPDGYNMILLSNKNHLIEKEADDESIKALLYMNHELIKSNMSLQNEKNVNLYNDYNDKDSTFFIKNNY